MLKISSAHRVRSFFLPSENVQSMTKPFKVSQSKMVQSILLSSFILPILSYSHVGNAADAVIKKWVDSEFTESTLSKEQQIKELEWFAKAAKPYKGLEIHVVSETLATHEYESNVLAKAFSEITGIRLIHELTGEDDVVKKIQTQSEKDIQLYDGYINDSDFIGAHFRSGKVLAITDLISGTGKSVTNPNLDLPDFIGLKFTTGPDNKLYQLPDQQFANLYWYRADWFERADLKKKFKELYGYELGVPVNWSAYEDIAEFFSVHVKELDGHKVYGHMDYGRMDPSIGWRFSDAWLSMAGASDVGLPNGLPVDEWGIRVENCHPVGASVSRGGEANGPASVYALDRFVTWLKKFAPPEAYKMDFSEGGGVPSQGHIAQQIFWYTAFTADMIKPGSPVVNADGSPKWKMAPSPKGPYWRQGMKLGYQDCGSWTFMKNTPVARRNAAWLYAQFVVSKSVSLKKTIVGLTPIRKSDIFSNAMTKMAPKLGGLVEFYRSKARDLWTPTGTNVPDYAELAPGWWRTLPKAVTGELTPQEATNELAAFLDERMEYISKNKKMTCAPILNKPKDPKLWLRTDGTSPKAKLENEKPKGQTVDSSVAWKGYENE